ncbi:hypothetical protein RA27_16035 [Ruegeria sp. ANG-R]|nr:hypothetical protein RA27_16035 [Ruegeria sp. ANG-R]
MTAAGIRSDSDARGMEAAMIQFGIKFGQGVATETQSAAQDRPEVVRPIFSRLNLPIFAGI